MGKPLKKEPMQLGTIGENVRRNLNAVILQAQSAGIHSFSFGFRDLESNQLVVHLQNLPAGDAVNLAGQQWMMAMQQEIDKHPEYDPKYRAIFADAIKEFQGIALGVNKKVDEYNKKHAKK